jgi:hypothetical protein
MLRLNALLDAARKPGCSPRSGGQTLALPLGVALSGLLAATTAVAQPAPQRQPPAGAPVAPSVARQQSGAAAAPPAAAAPAAASPAAPSPAGAALQPGGAAPAPGAAPQPAPPAAPAPPYPAVPYYPAPPQHVPQADPGAAPGYPPPGPQGAYAPYGGAYPPLPPGYPVNPSEIPPAPPPIPLRRKSPSMMWGGIALTAGGTIAFFTGTGLLASASNRYEIYCDFGGSMGVCETRADGPRQVAGAVISVAGGIMMAVGIPLWVIGGKKVPADGAAPAAPAQTTLSIGPGSAALQTRF